MEELINKITPDEKEETKRYLASKQIPQLFESLTAALLHHRPDDPVRFVQQCIDSLRDKTDIEVKWDTFINVDLTESGTLIADELK